jgi:hypothetical protein
VTDVPPPPPPPPPSFGAPPPGSSPDVGAALSYGWTKFGQNAGPLILAFIIPAIGGFFLNIIGSLIIQGTFGQLLFSVIGIVVQAMLGIAIYRVSLQIVNGQRADLGAARGVVDGILLVLGCGMLACLGDCQFCVGLGSHQQAVGLLVFVVRDGLFCRRDLILRQLQGQLRIWVLLRSDLAGATFGGLSVR